MTNHPNVISISQISREGFGTNHPPYLFRTLTDDDETQHTPWMHTPYRWISSMGFWELEGITSSCCRLIGQYPHHMTLCPPAKRCYGIHLYVHTNPFQVFCMCIVHIIDDKCDPKSWSMMPTRMVTWYFGTQIDILTTPYLSVSLCTVGKRSVV